MVYCDICQKDWKDDARYGKFLAKGQFTVHYYCLLSGSQLLQRGTDKSGIMGFLLQDIQDFLGNIKDVECKYCGRNRAGVKCSEKGCNISWHFPCGRNHNCVTQFIGQFNSYCSKHVPNTNAITQNRTVYCHICFSPIGDSHPATSIFSNCCLNIPNDFPNITLEDVKIKCFNHESCIQRYVVNAGYDAKCVNCSMGNMTKKQWQDQMRYKGIFVPMQMAVWENDEYFKKQVKNKCENIDCPNKTSSAHVWTCSACGCNPLHLKCAGVRSPEEYLCANCFDQSFIRLLPTTSKQ